MRLLLVSQSYAPHYELGGQPVKVQALAEHLARRGHEVTVLTTNFGRARSTKELVLNGVRVHYAGYVARYRTVTLNVGVRRFLARAGPFDAAHVFGYYDLLGPAATRWLRARGIPYVVEPIGTFRPIVRSIRKKRVYHAVLGRRVVEGAARVVATAPQESDELAKEGVPLAKLVVRRNGVDLAPFERLPPRGRFRAEVGIPSGAPLVLYLGRVSRKKGLDLLVRAFAEQDARAHLAIVGPDDGDGCTAMLEREIARLGIASRAHLLPARFGDAKLTAFADADIFALPSLNENFGNAAAEAAASGIPVIVTRTCGVAPLLDGRGALVIGYDKTELRQALMTLLRDPDRAADLGKAGRAAAAELSWAQPVREMEDLYAALVAEAR